MFGFNFGRKKILGIDIGTSSLKVIELELRDDKPYLSNYAWITVPRIAEENNKRETDSFEVLISEQLKKIIKEGKFKKTDAFIAIPAFDGLVTLIDFPDMPDKDMEQAIKFEAQKYIPTSLDDVVISWEVVDNEENKKEDDLARIKNDAPSEPSKKRQVLLVAASKKKVITYENIVRKSGIKLKGVEMENIAIVEALIGNDKGNFIIIDIGSRACNIIYVEKGIVKINRNIDVGGGDITKTIEKSLGITSERAEAMKISGGDFFSSQSSLHFSALDIITGEIARVKELLMKNRGNINLDALVLSGGTAKLSGLKDFLQNKTGIKTIIGNPFSRIGYDKKLEKVIEKIGGRLAVCAGLALKGIKESVQKPKK